MEKRYLILDDGTSFLGEGFGDLSNTTGELIINTDLNGYQEAITDPVYHNQIIMFTQPSIGNIGTNPQNYESIITSAKGIVVNQREDINQSPLKAQNLSEFLRERQIPGIWKIDTRALRQYVQSHHVQKASIVNTNDEHAFDQLTAAVLSNQQIQAVATPKPYLVPGSGMTIVVIDLGLRESIIRQLAKLNCNIIVVPWDTDFKGIISLAPEGVVISSGPGAPEEIDNTVLETIIKLQPCLPLFGIGLGHELIAIANGATVTKMASGVHGNHHPIRQIITNDILYADQSQTYQIERQSIDNNRLIITFVDLINNSIQGLRSRDYPTFSVQFSPEGTSGIDSGLDLFAEFTESILVRRRLNNNEFGI
ncbi:carbamoyl phosphate synthase small subunit [Fructilactobacillus florum]|uniref:carbamoyl-phosphate synthase (glutamine-hydrolyzing) n=1 Tax=Fructilactobacillus florum DSM 22689 = JCM 16035 TaxID=1423745 RepID=A0A0R2CUT5_9LACO|nr:carbamoyl phosphate synthase small subunit [Fructilactobacillus florum]KRM91740.1 carbamoyl-phosphate synthase small chain [Fructilactobacillus florum DSM 22689 = JCM 16035]